MEQPNLFGFEDPPAKLKRPGVPREGNCRLFFALFPANDAATQLFELATRLKTQHGMAGKLHPVARLHLTLDHLGDFKARPQDIVEAAGETARALQSASTAFQVSLTKVLSFGRNARTPPLVMSDSPDANPGLRDFRANLWDELARRGVPGAPRNSFTPHVTLLYDSFVLLEQPAHAVTWQATDFILVESIIGESRYEVLGRWALKA